MTELQIIRTEIERKKGRVQEIKMNIANDLQNIKEERRNLRKHERAREIINKVGLQTQQQLEFNISEITTLAMEAVFDNPYKLKVKFIFRRNKTECDLLFERDGNLINPLIASGGGSVDVAAFALRVASWSMQTPGSRKTLVLDEPFKHLRGRKENERVLQMIKEISKKLNLQIIIVGDDKVERAIMEQYADKLFQTSIKNGRTNLRQV